MKTILLASALVFVTLSAAAKTNNSTKKVSYSTAQSFQRQFGEVDNIEWNAAPEHMTKATFVSEGETVTAFFSVDGEYIATTVNRTINEVPAKLKASIKNVAKDATVVEIVELQGETDHAFFVKIQTEAGEKILKGYSNGYLRLTSL